MNLFARALIPEGFEDVFSDAALTDAMLRVETALAQAQAGLGIIPSSAATAIQRAVESLRLDSAALARDGAHAGTLAVPLVNALRAQVESIDPSAKDFVHFGSTSQDVLDTAMVLQTAQALSPFDMALERAMNGAAALARHHRDTPMLARTLMQAAGVTTFGYKAAQWYAALFKARGRMRAAADQALAVSLGGAFGNLAAFGGQGAELRSQLARALGLRDPEMSWHTDRQDWIALATAAGLACAAMSKIARDVALMAQTEVNEVSEPAAEGRGISSAMPHKRNPVLSMRIIALTQPVPGFIASLLAAMAQEHERALGAWQGELALWPSVFFHTGGGAHTLAELLTGLQVNVQACRGNIDRVADAIFPGMASETRDRLEGAVRVSADQVKFLLQET